MARVYTPGDEWPSHSYAYMRDALKDLRNRGWYLRKTSSHEFGIVLCRMTSNADFCSKPIHSTPAHGERWVKRTLMPFVSACPHQRDDRAEEPLLKIASDTLDEAEVLIDHAERCILHEESRRSAELLALALERGEEAEDLLLQADRAEQDAHSALESGAISTAGPAADALVSAETSYQTARHSTDKLQAAQVRSTPEVLLLWQRRRAVMSRSENIQSLRDVE